MIQVERGPAPEGFATRALACWNEYQAAKASNPALTASAFWSRIRSRLRADAAVLKERFRHKCAFCECKPEVCSNPQVEHYRPKSNPEFEDQMFSWENWLLSCGRCNQSKWTHFPSCEGIPCLLDPSTDNPGEHLMFRGSGILPTTQRGRETIRIVGLDRAPLSDDRALWLNHVRCVFVLTQNPQLFEAAKSYLIWATQDDAPHAAMTRQYLRENTATLGHPDTVHPHVGYQQASELLWSLIEQHTPKNELL